MFPLSPFRKIDLTGGNVKKLIFLLVLSICILGNASAGGKKEAGSEEKKSSTAAAEEAASEETGKQLERLRMGEGGTDFPTPWRRGKKGGGKRKSMLIYDSLLEKDDEGLIPWLAESYEIDEDGMTYVFRLRDNILWHDGEKLTAEDVEFTFEYFAKHIPIRSSLDFEDIVSVEAVDDLTVEIVANKPYATLLANIGLVHIVPKHVWEKVEDPYSYDGEDALVGSGPYILTERRVSENVMVYDAFEDFWGPTPGAKKIYWLNAADRVSAFLAGEIDIARVVSVDERPLFEDKSEYKIVQGPAFSGSRLVFNMDAHELLATKKFRQAVYYAFDSQEVIEKIGSGLGELSNPGILPPAHQLYNPNVKKYDHDIGRADRLLDELGYSRVGDDGIRVNAAGERLSFELYGSQRHGRLDTAKLFAEQMERAGIEFRVVGMDGSVQEERVAQGEFVTAIVGHAGLGNDADYLRERYAGGDLGPSTTELASKGYRNEEVLHLLREQRTITNLDKRKEVVYKIQELMAEDVVEIMMYYSYMTSAHRPAVYDEWMYGFDSRSVTSCKMSYMFYRDWREKQK